MSDRLIKKVSKIARNSLQKDLIRTLDLICEYAKNDIQKYKELLFIAFFNEQQIANYERFIELDYKNGWSLQDRKDRIIYTLLSKNIFTPHVLKEQAKIFTNGEIEVIENYNDYSFIIKFTSVVGIPSNLDNFKNFIHINKPAHLNFSIEFRYNTHNQVAYLLHKNLKVKTHKEIYDTRLYEDSEVAGKYHKHIEINNFRNDELKTKIHKEIYDERR
ncbi:putative phage tail protein [Fusobacterium polymorphum]|uniref:Terminase n=1 Tax=Fusobacterium nucleatum subsp. polymorphum TaxID=76857 RepID=A0A2C6BNF3_FUSNP|nr:putative phage tail protein [Fusobacterium polymorphum]PHI05753.1 terminase [Fusobacterium polymorphum]